MDVDELVALIDELGGQVSFLEDLLYDIENLTDKQSLEIESDIGALLTQVEGLQYGLRQLKKDNEE